MSNLIKTIYWTDWIKGGIKEIDIGVLFDSDDFTNDNSAVTIYQNDEFSWHLLLDKYQYIGTGDYTFYLKVKDTGDGSDKIKVRVWKSNESPLDASYDLSDGTNIDTGESISDIGNGWYAIEESFSITDDGMYQVQIMILDDDDSEDFLGDNSSGLTFTKPILSVYEEEDQESPGEPVDPEEPEEEE